MRLQDARSALIEQQDEISAVQRQVFELREKIKQVARDRDTLKVDKEGLARELENRHKCMGEHKADMRLLETTVVRLQGEHTHLRTQVESLRDQRDSKCVLLAFRDHEVQMLGKELDKIGKQKSALQHTKAKVRYQPKAKSETLLRKAKIPGGLPKAAIRPFTSQGFGFGLFSG